MGNNARLKQLVISETGSSRPVCRVAPIDGNAAIARKNIRIKYFMYWAFRYLLSLIFCAADLFRLPQKPTKWCNEPKGQTQLQKNRPNTTVNMTVASAHRRAR